MWRSKRDGLFRDRKEGVKQGLRTKSIVFGDEERKDFGVKVMDSECMKRKR